MSVAPSRIKEFRRRTRARTVCGYTTEVDWYEAIAFELLLFDTMLNQFVRPTSSNRLSTRHHSFAQKLGFRSDPKWKPSKHRKTGTSAS
jgi:hypothetical protein